MAICVLILHEKNELGRFQVRRGLGWVIAVGVVVSAVVGVRLSSDGNIAQAAEPPVGTLIPSRLLDTRPGELTVDGIGAGAGATQAGTVQEVVVAGRGGVPTDATAAFLNVTVVFPTAPGFATVFPCGSAQPTASNLNYGPGDVVPNAVLTKIGVGGKVCIYTLATTHLIADVNGYVPATGAVGTLVPARLLDTRPGELTVDGISAGGGATQAGTVQEVVVAGRGGVPINATAAFLNVTAVFPEAPGFATVYPCGTPQPTASNLNYGPGDVVPNAILTKIGVGGKVCIYTLATTHLLVDVNGFIPAGGAVGTLIPARLLDTRPGEKTVDGISAGGGATQAGTVQEVVVAGRGGVPSDASAAFLNVTVVFPEAPGFATVFPCGSAQPTASNLNYGPGDVVPNAVLTKIGVSGKVCIFTLATTHLIVDVNGFVPGATTPPAATTTTTTTTTTTPTTTTTTPPTTTTLVPNPLNIRFAGFDCDEFYASGVWLSYLAVRVVHDGAADEPVTVVYGPPGGPLNTSTMAAQNPGDPTGYAWLPWPRTGNPDYSYQNAQYSRVEHNGHVVLERTFTHADVLGTPCEPLIVDPGPP